MSAPAGIWGQTLADADDLTLLSMVRDGDPDAYAELWRRHLPAAYAVAHRHRGRTSAEDIVAEASLRVYDLIRAGKGPMTNFRSYFLTTVRSSAVDAARTELRAVPTEDAALEAATPSSPAYDASASVDHDLVRAAFKRLPERDQQILWHTAVEGVSPAAVGTSMGISANGVSVLALRARDSLRAKYLDAHADRAIGRADDDECRWVLAQMGRYVRGKLPVRQRARVEEHLASCLHARGLAFEMAEVNRALPAVMVPLILLGGSSVAGAWLGAAGAGATASDSPKGPREEPKAALAAAMVANIGGKAAALAVGLVLGVSYVAAPGGLSALGGGGHVSAGVAGSGGNASGAASGSGGADGTLNPSSGSGTTSKVSPDPATTGLPVAPTPSPAPVAASPASSGVTSISGGVPPGVLLPISAGPALPDPTPAPVDPPAPTPVVPPVVPPVAPPAVVLPVSLTWETPFVTAFPGAGAGVSTVAFNLASGTLNVTPATGSGWSCAPSGTVVTCSGTGATSFRLAATAPTTPITGPIVLTATVTSAAGLTAVSSQTMPLPPAPDPVPFDAQLAWGKPFAVTVGGAMTETRTVTFTVTDGSLSVVADAGSGWTCATVGGAVRCSGVGPTSLQVLATPPLTQPATPILMTATVTSGAGQSTTTTVTMPPVPAPVPPVAIVFPSGVAWDTAFVAVVTGDSAAVSTVTFELSAGTLAVTPDARASDWTCEPTPTGMKCTGMGNASLLVTATPPTSATSAVTLDTSVTTHGLTTTTTEIMPATPSQSKIVTFPQGASWTIPFEAEVSAPANDTTTVIFEIGQGTLALTPVAGVGKATWSCGATGASVTCSGRGWATITVVATLPQVWPSLPVVLKATATNPKGDSSVTTVSLPGVAQAT